jgi:hypothetical protein
MKMQVRAIAIAAASAAMGMAIGAGGCSSAPRLPATPVPAALNDYQAAVMADRYVDQQSHINRPVEIYSIRPMGWGYLVAYQSDFNPELRPPKEWHLITVKHDGSTRELEFRRGE